MRMKLETRNSKAEGKNARWLANDLGFGFRLSDFLRISTFDFEFLTMLLFFDIGNTNTHLGLANSRRVLRQTNIPTAAWFAGRRQPRLQKFAGAVKLDGAALCSVVPRRHAAGAPGGARALELMPASNSRRKTLRGVGIDYLKPETIGPDRLANAVAARHHFGAPAVVVDFGTAVTFDVVNRAGDYAGGIIAPGLAAMTDYLHEKTALLPRIRIREIKTAIGRSTEEAMLVGAVHGYRGLDPRAAGRGEA